MKNGTDVDDDWDMYSDTPQGGINGLSNDTYLTNARHNTKNNTNTLNASGTNESTTNNNSDVNVSENRDNTFNGKVDTDANNKTFNSDGNSNFNNTEKWVEHITGKRGTVSYSKMIQEFRDSILNLDVAVISELSDLFMCVW